MLSIISSILLADTSVSLVTVLIVLAIICLIVWLVTHLLRRG